MKYLFFLSGENTELARSEVINLLKTHCKIDVVEINNQIAVLDVDETRDVFNRLALTHEVCKFIASCEIEELDDLFSKIKLPDKKLCVRVKKIGRVCIDSALMERKLGSILWRRGAKISVSQPEVVIKVYIFKKAYTGYLIHSTDKKQFLLRQPNLKPFFRPGVIIPKLARALVNISGVRVNEILLDPMCGAGTILIEAGLMNIRFAGVEIFTNIVEGCAKNLSHFNLPVNLVKGDVKRLPFKDESFHAIVTDFPYLHSSKSYGRLDELYSRSLEEFQRVLKKGRRAVVISNLDVDEVILNHLEIEEKFYQRIHGSFTRRIFVCRKER